MAWRRREHRLRWVARSSLYGWVIATWLWVGGLVVQPPWMPALIAASVLTTFLLFAELYLVGADSPARVDDEQFADVTIELDDDSLVLQRKTGEQRLDAGDIEASWVDEGGLIGLRFHDGGQLLVGGVEQPSAQRLRRCLGATSRQRTMRLPLAGAALRSPWVAFGSVFVLMLGWLFASVGIALSCKLAWVMAFGTGEASNLPLLALVVPLTVTAAATLVVRKLLPSLRPRRIIVGSDALIIGEGPKKRTVSVGSIERIDDDPEAVRIHHHGGGSELLPKGAGGEALGACLREALAARSRKDPPKDLALLDRDDRGLEDWKHELERISGTEGGYRRSGLRPGELLAAARDAANSPQRRVAAAYSLATIGSDQVDKQLRIAAHACADEHLRRALEGAIDGSLEVDAIDRAAAKLVN
jgi:hypothetical protein